MARSRSTPGDAHKGRGAFIVALLGFASPVLLPLLVLWLSPLPQAQTLAIMIVAALVGGYVSFKVLAGLGSRPRHHGS